MAGERAWRGRGICMVGGLCVTAGHTWRGACMAAGMHGGGACMVRGMCGRGVHGGGGHVCHARPLQILRDTVNERAVRILLECILVKHLFDFILMLDSRI